MAVFIKIAAVWLIKVLLVLPSIAGAQPLILDPEEGAYDVRDFAQIHLKRFEELSAEFTIDALLPSPDELIALEQSGAFEPVKTRQIGIGAAVALPVVRIHVANPREKEQEWILAFNRASDYVYQVYFLPDGAPLPAEPVFYFDDERDIWDRSEDVWISARLTLPPETSGRIFVSFLNINGGAAMTLETPAHYAAKRQWQNLHFFAVIGLTLGMTIITAALMLILRRYVAFYYLGAVLSGVLVVMLIEQQFEALFPDLAQLSIEAGLVVYVSIAGPVFALLFQRQFFADVGGTGRVFGAVMLGTALFCVLSVVAAMEFALIPIEVVLVLQALCVLLITTNGILAVRRGFVGRWPFFLASTVYAFSLAVIVASYVFSYVISMNEAGLLLLYAIAFESLCMAMTMFAHVRWMRSEKEAALVGQLKAAEERLAIQKAMSHAAHDIRQPLASLRLAMSAAATKDNSPERLTEAIDYLEEIVQSQLASDRRTKEQAVASEEAAGQFEVAVLMSNIATMFTDEAKAKGISLRIRPCTQTVVADVFAVMRIVSNLVANAVRNTDAGKVLVGCRRRGNMLRLDVIDTGPGFTPEQLASLKKPGARAGSYEGAGLGLGIVQELASAHALQFDVASAPEKGTRFSLFLPLG